MLRKIKTAILLIATTFVFGVGLVPAIANADCTTPATTQEEIQCGACNASGTAQAACANAPTTAANNISSTLENVINIASLIAGALAVIMLIIGGIRYASSSGNEQAIAGAKRTIIYALIGLVIVAMAQVVVHFVLHNLTSGSEADSSSSSSSSSSPSSGCDPTLGCH